MKILLVLMRLKLAGLKCARFVAWDRNNGRISNQHSNSFIRTRFQQMTMTMMIGVVTVCHINSMAMVFLTMCQV